MIRALVIDDSAYNRVTISRMLESNGKIKVVGTAGNGEEGIKQVMRHQPDVITLDLEMPVMDGFSFLRWLMHNKPTAVIAVSSRSSDRSVFKALDLGAVDFIAKPGGRVSPRLEEIRRDLIAKVLQVEQLSLENLRKRVDSEELSGGQPPSAVQKVEGIELIAIGCSTGGPPALQHLFQALPLLPIPIVVAQHMPATFTRLFADRVDRLTKYTVKEATDGEQLAPGFVYVAPGGMQMEVHRSTGFSRSSSPAEAGAPSLQSRIVPHDGKDAYAPSVDRLLASASESCGEALIAVILTGMGDDGAAAMRRVRQRGGKTIAESSDTAIIFGMPNEAIKTGAVDQILPLDEIAGAIERLCYISKRAEQR